jgi:Protein phosphatase 2C
VHDLRVIVGSDPGSLSKPNEDAVAIGIDTVAVLDGATARTDTGCIHGVSWFSHHLADAIKRHSSNTPAETLAAAIADVADQHRDTCDLNHPATPSAAVAIMQIRDNALRYLVLGDVTIALYQGTHLHVLTDSRVNATARTERAAADALISGSAEKNDALVRMKNAELNSRNVTGGFWVAAANPAIVSEALTGQISSHDVSVAAVLSDGATRAVHPLGLYDWPGLMRVLRVGGPDGLIRQVRTAEDSDPAGVRWPRNKVHDDATAVLIVNGLHKVD